ncbi:tetratricopeptide repeat protein [Pseudofrankia saprophytica]|uniref:tetratricopeptide repeat protein n=1 Tax=Pseudofrankia saprophytica TaxID=298655 RepID=UPI0018E31F58|nr:tetratricopeptide repeat protein [Pseudofrankia saprophytica]
MEAFLAAIQQGDVHACRVEGPVSPQLANTDIVDFDLIDNSGQCIFAAQVKSAGLGKIIRAPEAFAILVRLVTSQEAERYQLITQAIPDKNCKDLARVLASAKHPGDLHYGVSGLLSGSPKALKQLQSLSPAELVRLVSASIEFDSREDDQTRADLRDGIRNWRARERRGSGEGSSGLVLNHLVAKTLQRAADPKLSVWTITEFLADLNISNESLSAALGRQDWGVITGPVPPIPDIPRSTLVGQVAATFETSTESRVGTVLCAITGLSGIGKSSLAVAYIAEHSHLYDQILWVDGTTSDALAASFTRVLSHLGTQSEGESATSRGLDYLREKVHALLQRISGRWLIVFDDVIPDSVKAWLPRFGRGDVIVTSTASAGWSYAQTRILVERMNSEEALNLLVRRLRLDGTETERHQNSLLSLVETLDAWPLAIELASGYIVSCGLPPDRITEYRDLIKDRAMDDHLSVPQGYPRTLVSAIRTSLERLRQGAKVNRVASAVAVEVLGYMSFFGAVGIPLHLAMASACISPLEVPQDLIGPAVLDESDGLVRETLRELVNISFVHRSEPLPSAFNFDSLQNETVSLNTVLQTVLRREFEATISPDAPLTRAAFHTTRWLGAGMDHDESEWTWQVAQHASELVSNIRRLNVRNGGTAALLGNLAGFYFSTGRSHDAVDLLELELRWLNEIEGPRGLLTTQTRITLATVHAAEQTSATAAILSEQLGGEVYAYVEGLVLENSMLAADLAAQAYALLNIQLELTPNEPEIRSVHGLYGRLVEGLPTTPVAEIALAISAINRLIQSGRPAEAEKSARALLVRPESSRVAPVMEIRRLLIEALAAQRKWDAAMAELDAFSRHVVPNSLHHFSIRMLIHNAGFTATLNWLFADESAAPFLGRLLEKCGSDEVLKPAGHELVQLEFLRAVERATRADFAGAIEKLKLISDRSFADEEETAVRWERVFFGFEKKVRTLLLKDYHDREQARISEIVAKIPRRSPVWELFEDPKSYGYYLENSSATTLWIQLIANSDILRGDSSSSSIFPIAILEPRQPVLVTLDPKLQPVELKVYRLASAGFRRVLGDVSAIPESTGVSAFVEGGRFCLRDEDGMLLAIADNVPDMRWIERARTAGRIAVLYGFDFFLNSPMRRDEIFGPKPRFREVIEKSGGVTLAFGLADWRSPL